MDVRTKKKKKKVRGGEGKETLLHLVVCEGRRAEERQTERGRGTATVRSRERENPNQKSEEQNNKAG